MAGLPNQPPVRDSSSHCHAPLLIWPDFIISTQNLDFSDILGVSGKKEHSGGISIYSDINGCQSKRIIVLTRRLKAPWEKRNGF